jgi:hypothetical protein
MGARARIQRRPGLPVAVLGRARDRCGKGPRVSQLKVESKLVWCALFASIFMYDDIQVPR